MISFGQRLEESMARYGQLCVGIDPHVALLDAWGLSQSAQGLREFALRVVDAAAGQVGVVKPQVAFFERFGSAGYAALEEAIMAARSADLIVISDAKRGDIGTTMQGYTSAWLDAGSTLESDAVTLSAYLGANSLRESITSAVNAGKGVFVLGATSNPEAFGLQSALMADNESAETETVAARVVRDATWPNQSVAFAASALGPVGVVIGATVDRADFGLNDALLSKTPILAPGFGAQGASADSLWDRFGGIAGQVLANESRSILSAGIRDISDAVASRAKEYRRARD